MSKATIYKATIGHHRFLYFDTTPSSCSTTAVDSHLVRVLTTSTSDAGLPELKRLDRLFRWIRVCTAPLSPHPVRFTLYPASSSDIVWSTVQSSSHWFWEPTAAQASQRSQPQLHYEGRANQSDDAADASKPCVTLDFIKSKFVSMAPAGAASKKQKREGGSDAAAGGGAESTAKPQKAAVAHGAGDLKAAAAAPTTDLRPGSAVRLAIIVPFRDQADQNRMLQLREYVATPAGKQARVGG